MPTRDTARVKLSSVAVAIRVLHLFCAPALCILCVGSGWDLHAAEPASREVELKAAYLLNFVKFVEWPAAEPRGALTICLLENAQVQRALTGAIQSNKTSRRPIAVRSIAGTERAEGCDVLYLDRQAKGAGARVLATIATAPVLTVSDMPEFARNGGMIELFTERGRLRFKINVENAHRAGLRISSSLLQLAASVEKGGAK